MAMTEIIEVPRPDVPVKVALIGAGNRSQTIYQPLFPALKDWIEVVAVCDPVREHCDSMADSLGARTYYDIHEMVRERPMEGVLIVAPVPAHHSLSVYLSSHGIHNHCETSWCSLLAQAREMIDTARDNGVVARVAENFFRFAVDRFAQRVKAVGYLGRIGRIFSYADHTGYHNNSRWIRFTGTHPVWVQAIEHQMDTPSFRSLPHRFHAGETFRGRYFAFPHGMLVVDQAANVKGFLGRHPRPGYTEWQGSLGTLVHRATGKASFSDAETELRRASEAGVDPEHNVPVINSLAEQVSPVVYEADEVNWLRAYSETPDGTIEHVNPFRTDGSGVSSRKDYGAAVMDHVVDFALAVRRLRESEFDGEDALMSLMMDLAARESVLNEGKRIRLPLDGELEAEAQARQRLEKEFGVDPLDVEGMLAISHRRP